MGGNNRLQSFARRSLAAAALALVAAVPIRQGMEPVAAASAGQGMDPQIWIHATFVAGPDRGRTLTGALVSGGQGTPGATSGLVFVADAGPHSLMPQGTTVPVQVQRQTGSSRDSIEIYSWSYGVSSPLSLVLWNRPGSGNQPAGTAGPGGVGGGAGAGKVPWSDLSGAALLGPQPGDQVVVEICLGQYDPVHRTCDGIDIRIDL